MVARRLAQALVLAVALVALGGSARASTSSGANGETVFVRGGNLMLVSGATLLAGTDPSWSPDGTKLAFVQSGTIKTCSYSSNTCGSVTSSGVTGTEPVWSPDGTKLAYVTAGNQIHTMKTDGTSDTAVTSSGTNTDPSWSPDGTQIVFTNNGAIAKVSSSGGSITALTTTGATSTSQPAWSPDGSTIAFQGTSSGHTHIFVIDQGGGSATQVTPTSSDDETAPSWSPDGDSIVYADSVHGLEDVTEGVGGSWGSPSILDSNTGDATPDWQTAKPIAVSAPTIFGGTSPQTGTSLSTSNGTWNGASSSGFTYQWQRCDSSGNNCSVIGGATTSSYTPVSADVGHKLRSVVTASNTAGSTASSPSNATGVVVTAGTILSPTNTAYPVITLPTGETVPQTGDTLTASTGTWTGTSPITFTYQWKKCVSPTGSCFDIPKATLSSFTVDTSLYGWSIRVQVTATNSGASVSQNSVATELVTETAPVTRVTPTIDGDVVVDSELSTSGGSWDGSKPLAFTYSWRRCDPQGDYPSCVEVGTDETYTPKVADIGYTLRVWVTAKNDSGTALAITNHTFPVVDKQHFAPAMSAPPLVSGLAEIGETLSASAATFVGDTPITTKVRWQRCDATGADCHDIRYATNKTYVPFALDLGSRLRVVYRGTNAYGFFDAASDPTDPVVAAPPHHKGKTILGTAKDDYLTGTGNDDTIRGLGGNDTILGLGGRDRIDGGAGNDVITGGAGEDVISGGAGSDTIYAADGERDVITCGPGKDRVVADKNDQVAKDCEVVEQS